MEHRRDVHSGALCAGAASCTGGGQERARARPPPKNVLQEQQWLLHVLPQSRHELGRERAVDQPMVEGQA